MKYRKRPVIIEATQWFKNGDHPAVCTKRDSASDLWGYIKTLEGEHIVTPGDWIITGVKGENYPCKPDIFAMTYEPVEESPAERGGKQMNLRDAAQNALEALEYGQHSLKQVSEYHWESRGQLAMQALRAALEPEQAEPVAWMYTGIKQDGTEHGPHLVWKPAYMDAMSESKGAQATPLYAAPPQRKPLTDEQIAVIEESCMGPVQYGGHENITQERVFDVLAFARAVEQAHGIGEE